MCKIKNFIFIIGLAMLLSSTAYSKVCFLGGGNDFDNDGTPDDNCLSGSMATFSNCPGKFSCVIPSQDAKPKDICQEGGVKRYLPEDCCTNAENYVPCNEEGQICTGKKCKGVDAEGKDYLSCEPGKCSCASKYKYDCSGNGLIGKGKSCGGKYESCQCDTSKYHKCDANAAGSGGACTDSTGTYYKTCSCPTGNNWTTDKSNCCKGYDATCTSSTGKASYKCKDNDTAISLGCICGTKKNTTTGCLTGCSDGDYTYIGAGKNITCSNSVNFLLGEGKCGNGCHCDTGYYNYTELCNLKGAGVCAALGYTEATCSDDWIACPFNSNIKKCISSDCYTYQGFCTDQTPTFCATLGYTDTSCTGDWLACPLNAKAKKCLPTPATIEEEPDDCPSGQALINGACKTIHANCAAAGLYTQAECSATGYICGLGSTTIYTSATGTTATCYTRLNDLCPLGYATSASSCLTTPDGLTCAEGYLLSIEGNYYSGSKKCGKCECSLILSGGNLSQGCPCTSDKPYYVNGACSATCPGHAMGLECFMCSLAGEYVR